MKCDELKSLKNIGLSFDTTTLHKQVIAEDSEGKCYGFDSWEEIYLKSDVDAAIAELKQNLHDAKMQADLAECAVTEYKIDCNKLKSEADKVIANKDYEIKELKNSITKLLGMDIEQVMKEVIQKTLIYGDGFVPVEHAMKLVADLRHHKAVLRHHKCKRSLAMANWCEAEMWKIRNTPLCEMFAHEVWQHDEFWQRWYERWLKIAEKFKE